jgi:cytochrome P450
MTPALTDEARRGATELFGLEPSRLRCPYPTFAALRATEPIAWFDEIEAYVITSYDLLVEVLRQPDRFSSRFTTGPVVDRQMSQMLRDAVEDDQAVRDLIERRTQFRNKPVLVRADPPDHSRQRAIVNRAFSPSVVRRLEPEIQRLADELIDGFIDAGDVEVVFDYATPLPMTVIAAALGVSLDRLDEFKTWSDGIVASVGKMSLTRDELVDTMTHRADMEEYLAEVIEARRGEPGEDLISRLVHADLDGDRLSRNEICEMVVQMLLAGNETTAKLITAMILHIINTPGLEDELRSNPELIAPLADEVLRLEPPAGGLYRTAVTDYELGGVHLPAGTHVLLFFAAGNRDPETFPLPDECRLARDDKSPALAFGLGAHYCVGAGLARAEARITIQTLLARCQDLRLAIDPADIAYERSYMVHGIQKLPITFEATDHR